MYVHIVVSKIERGWRGMVTRGRSRLGRPPVPEEQRNACLTCYLPARVIARLGVVAERRGTSRNKLAAQILSEVVDALERDPARVWFWEAAARERA